MESQGLIRSSSSVSSSSFDSCSDLLGSLEYSLKGSAHRVTPTVSRQLEADIRIERIQAVEESECPSVECYDSKQVKGSQDGCTGLSLDQDGQSLEGSMKQVPSSQVGDVESFEDKEAMLRVETHSVKKDAEGFSTLITANKVETLGNSAFEKGVQLSSPACLQPAGYRSSPLSSLESLDKVTLLPEAESNPVVSAEPLEYGQEHLTKRMESFQQSHSSELEDNEHVPGGTQPLQPRQLNALESLVNSANDRFSVENNKDVVDYFDHAFQGHAHTSNIGERISSVSEAEHDLQQLENSIKFFDLHKTNSVLPHPLRSLSIGCGRPGLEEVDDHIDPNEVEYKNQIYMRSMSAAGVVRKNRRVAAEPAHHNGKELKSASMLSWLDSEEARIVHQSYIQDRDDLQSSANEQKSDVIGSVDLGAGTSSKSSLVDWKERMLAQSLDGEEGNHQPVMDEELFGRTPVKGSLKLASLEMKNGEPISWENEDLGPDELFRYVEALDVKETYVDMILDMEDAQLNFDESRRGKFSHAASNSTMGMHCPSQDGSLSSSTSGLQMLSSYCTLSAKDIPFIVDWVEVVGARQRRGGSSLGERMVGVKDHTVYCIKVVSGKHEWEVLRRYRDFVDFYHQLKRIFNARTGRYLPSPLEQVESESRNVFGNISPNVVVVRSFRIERCLQSLLQAGPPFSTTPPLFWFLRPPQGAFAASVFEEHLMIGASSLRSQLGSLDSPQLQSPRSDIGSSKMELDLDSSPFTVGKTIKLVSSIHPKKSLKQLLYAQHHACAGCYKHLDLEKGLIQGFAQTLGRGKPRLCEYSGQIFCSSCHLNDFAVLPAHVLRHWDFTPRRVSQLAKAYLDSIYDQPLLCVSAVNPYLYSRVPILSHVKETRRKLSRVFSCMRCPSRARIQQTMGSRRYLLENNDFFALRDLEDLSKGAFAVLPGLLTAVLENLKIHITKQCSVCQDTGEWCGAGILCEDSFSSIFPFQEENLTNCKICNAPFHKKCFLKCTSCPSCPKEWRENKAMQTSESLDAFDQEELNDHNQEDLIIPFPDGQAASASSLGGPVFGGPPESVSIN